MRWTAARTPRLTWCVLTRAREGRTANQAHQEDQGVVAVGHACEIVVQHSLVERVQANPEPPVPSKTVLSEVKVLHAAGDDQLRFPTQQEKEDRMKISVDESDDARGELWVSRG